MTRKGQTIGNERQLSGRTPRILRRDLLSLGMLAVSIRSITCRHIRRELTSQPVGIGQPAPPFSFPDPRENKGTLLFLLLDLYINPQVNGRLRAIL